MRHPENKCLRLAQGGILLFHCQGCDHMHAVYPQWIDPKIWSGDTWQINSVAPLDISPSLRVSGVGGDKTMCHSFIKEGKIQFLNDCTHDLAGQTVDMVEFEED